MLLPITLPSTTRRGLLRAHEALLGRNTFEILNRLDHAVDFDSASWLKQLAAFLGHATSEIPYWQARLGVISQEAFRLDELQTFPILTRDEIVRHRDEMRWQGPGKCLIHKSGGTTDDNLIFYWGREREAWDRATRARGLSRLGVLPGDSILHLWPRERASKTREALKDLARDTRDWLIADPVVDPRPWTHKRLQRIIEHINRFRPKAIIAYPSWLMRVAAFVKSEDCSLTHQPHLLLTCGEVLFAYQREYIEKIFKTNVYQEYGSQDAGLIAHEDTNQKLHPNPEPMLVELLRNGKAASPGELGELVVTHFYTQRMPFIRYATGDVARMPSSSKFSFTDPDAVFPTIEGRTSDLLIDDTGNLKCGRPIIQAIMEKTGIHLFNLQQGESGKIEVSSARKTGIIPKMEVAGVLRDHLGSAMQLDFIEGDDFESLRSGKHRFVCNPQAGRLLSHDTRSGTELSRSFPQRLEHGSITLA